jgi:hypothetical protein
MEFIAAGKPQHTGMEKFVVEYDLTDQGDAYDVQGKYVQFTIRPERVRLVWDRQLGGEWEPNTSVYGRGGSKITGRRVLKSGELGGQDGQVEVYGWDGSLTPYATSLPGLDFLVKTISQRLPK